MPRILTVALNPAIDVSSEADSVRTSHKVRTYNETYDPGGGGVNVARVVTELGGDVEVLYLAGGATGTLLGELLDRNRIRRQLIRIAGNTRISFTVQERSTGREFRFVGNGPTVDATELGACLDAIRASDFNYLVASGSLPIGVPPDTFAILAGIAAAKGARFVLDSSGLGLSETLKHGPVFLVKPSLNELEQLVGHALDRQAAEDAAMDLVKRGAAEMVAVTMGEDGVVLASKDGILSEPALKVEARSTVGAGDSFLAALTLGLAGGRALGDALLFGVAAGAAAVLQPGTKLCTRFNTLRLYDEAMRSRAASA